MCPASSAFVLKPLMRKFFEERRREDVNGKPAKRHLNFVRMQSSENRGQIPRDQRKSHKIRANVNPREQFCINPTLQPISLSSVILSARGADGCLAITRWKKIRERKIWSDRSPSNSQSFSPDPASKGSSPCILTFWGGFFECGRRFGAISLNLASAAEESGLIPAEMECGLSSLPEREK